MNQAPEKNIEIIENIETTYRKVQWTITDILSPVFYLVTIGIIYFGWQVRKERYFSPEAGIGYILGIAGTSLMLLLLLYPVRKKFRFMHNWGTTQGWFAAHMMMGILGPLLILFHCNFTLGSQNSRVALFSTLFVALSGIVGRYIYKKISFSFTDKQINLKIIKQEIKENRSTLTPFFAYAPDVLKWLVQFEQKVKISYEHTLLSAFYHSIKIFYWYKVTFFKINRSLKKCRFEKTTMEGVSGRKKKRKLKEADYLIKELLFLILKVAEFNFYERLFALWHLFHLPLFILLVIVSAIHIVAVHMY